MKKRKVFQKSFAPPQQSFVIAAWAKQAHNPGQVPGNKFLEEAREAQRMMEASPRTDVAAALMEDTSPVFSPAKIVNNLGLNPQQQLQWARFLADATSNAPNEIVLRQSLFQKFQNERLDPELRSAIFHRTMNYAREVQKSLVDVYTPDELRKARQVTPIGGITEGGYRKVAEGQYVKEEPGQGKQMGLFAQPQPASSAAPKAPEPPQVTGSEKKVDVPKVEIKVPEAPKTPEAPKAPEAPKEVKAYKADDVVSGKAPYKPGDKLGTQHDSPENAFVVDDYPYGFRLRTQKRYWVESNENGQRMMTQTKNPKNGKWNKPDASTYQDVLIPMFDEQGHINHGASLSSYTEDSKYIKFVENHPDYIAKLPEKNQVKIKIAASFRKHRMAGKSDHAAMEAAYKDQQDVLVAAKRHMEADEAQRKQAEKERKAAGPTGPAPELPKTHRGVDVLTPEQAAGMGPKELKEHYRGLDDIGHRTLREVYIGAANKATETGHYALATQLKHLAGMHRHWTRWKQKPGGKSYESIPLEDDELHPTSQEYHSKLKAHVAKNKVAKSMRFVIYPDRLQKCSKCRDGAQFILRRPLRRMDILRKPQGGLVEGDEDLEQCMKAGMKKDRRHR